MGIMGKYLDLQSKKDRIRIATEWINAAMGFTVLRRQGFGETLSDGIILGRLFIGLSGSEESLSKDFLSNYYKDFNKLNNVQIIIGKVEKFGKLNLSFIEKQKIASGDEVELLKLVDVIFTHWGLKNPKTGLFGQKQFLEWFSDQIEGLNALAFNENNLMDTLYDPIFLFNMADAFSDKSRDRKQTRAEKLKKRDRRALAKQAVREINDFLGHGRLLQNRRYAARQYSKESLLYVLAMCQQNRLKIVAQRRASNDIVVIKKKLFDYVNLALDEKNDSASPRGKALKASIGDFLSDLTFRIVCKTPPEREALEFPGTKTLSAGENPSPPEGLAPFGLIKEFEVRRKKFKVFAGRGEDQLLFVFPQAGLDPVARGDQAGAISPSQTSAREGGVRTGGKDPEEPAKLTAERGQKFGDQRAGVNAATTGRGKQNGLKGKAKAENDEQKCASGHWQPLASDFRGGWRVGVCEDFPGFKEASSTRALGFLFAAIGEDLSGSSENCGKVDEIDRESENSSQGLSSELSSIE